MASERTRKPVRPAEKVRPLGQGKEQTSAEAARRAEQRRIIERIAQNARDVRHPAEGSTDGSPTPEGFVGRCMKRQAQSKAALAALPDPASLPPVSGPPAEHRGLTGLLKSPRGLSPLTDPRESISVAPEPVDPEVDDE
ncbi:hypothetical protein CO046_00960 [Candidatus Peregrinibacteria bacterium CG_4_9_14_0_2_um_filter_53_11]|nr:MAG: hypothetical protein CO046_00960 [Candidatus Peregrinibacteria bacterium CG_4_9_14_0_2_um_filter_53_11]